VTQAIAREGSRRPGCERQVVDFYRQNPGAIRRLERGLERGGRRVKAPTLPLRQRVRAPARERLPEIKDRGRPTRVERWVIDRLIPYAKNARTHTDAQVAAIRIATGTVIKPIGARAVGKVVNDDQADWREAWALYPGDVAYIWHGGVHAGVVQTSLEVCRFTVRSQIIWAKSQLVISRGHYHAQHEPCFYAVRDGRTGHWTGDRKQTTLWQFDKPRQSETGHSTQKPVECMRRPIENNSAPGQAVYEPFSGSGTTIIAAEMTGRVAHAIEIASDRPPITPLCCVARSGGCAGQLAPCGPRSVRSRRGGCNIRPPWHSPREF
jgi:hypothetical protein